MNESKILVTMKNIQRNKIISEILEKKLMGVQASQILGIISVYSSRLKKKVKLYSIQYLL